MGKYVLVEKGKIRIFNSYKELKDYAKKRNLQYIRIWGRRYEYAVLKK